MQTWPLSLKQPFQKPRDCRFITHGWDDFGGNSPTFHKAANCGRQTV